MKILVIILVLVCFNPVCFAWDKEDTAMQAAVVSLLLVDMSQTLYISSHEDSYRELNPILGEHPSKDKVYMYFIGGIIAHTAISYLIEKVPWIENPKQWRRVWQGSFIIVESGVVLRNSVIGIGFSY